MASVCEVFVKIIPFCFAGTGLTTLLNGSLKNMGNLPLLSVLKFR